jgi:ribulose-5-phosphate 4-epimerase/fuculose-1-phosphate aldolase
MLLQELRELVVRYTKQMSEDRLVSARQGNLSALDRESGLIAITPSAVDYATVTAEDIVVISKDDDIVEGRWRPTSESPMHTLFYRERDDIGAIMHSHAPLTSVFATTYETMPLALVETAACIGHSIKVAPYATPGSIELGKVCLQIMGGGTAVVMGGHGLLVVGPDLPLLYSSAISVEDNARVLIHSRAMGATPRAFSDDEARIMHEEWVATYKPVVVSK